MTSTDKPDTFSLFLKEGWVNSAHFVAWQITEGMVQMQSAVLAWRELFLPA